MDGVFGAESLTRTYCREWAEAIKQDESFLDVPPSRHLRRLATVDAFEDPTSPDLSHVATAQSVSSRAFNANLDKFVESEGSARKQLGDLRERLSEIRTELKDNRDVVSLVLREQFGPAYELDTKIASYLLVQSAMTRLGETIEFPGKAVEDRSLQILLGLFRIVTEHEFDETFGLPWYADDKTPEAKRFITWETKAGAVGEAVGSAMGRAVAVAVTGVLGTLIKLPDELSVGLAYMGGIGLRKTAEWQMHKYLLQHEETQ